jgi:putative protein-disulfide isomerase
MSRPQLLYGFDALCGWCYVFQPSIQAVRKAFHRHLDIEIVCGGLLLGSNVGTMQDLRDFLKRAIPKAEAASGVQFGDRFTKQLMRQDDVVLDSEPLCRAIFAARDTAIAPDQTVDFALALSQAFYRDGKRLDRETTLSTVAGAVGIDATAFLARWSSLAGMGETAKGLAFARAMEIRTYPTLWVRTAAGTTRLFSGFKSPDDTVKLVDQALSS